LRQVNNLATGVTINNTGACSGGGTISVTVSEAISGTVSNGDSMSVTANSCSENGRTINGRIDYGFSNLSGTISSSSAWSGSVALKYSNVTLRTGGFTIGADGDMSLSYNQSSYQHATSAISGSSIQMDLTKSDGTVGQRKLTNYQLNASVNGSSNTSIQFYVDWQFSKLGNINFTVTTRTPFQATGAENRSAGSTTVTAANKSSATLTAIDSTNVRIDIDSNGDGAIDQTINTTWADLKSRI